MVDIEIPEWLTKTFLEELLANESGVDKIEIIKYESTRCVPKGANFLSTIIRTDIVFREHILNENYIDNDKISLVFKIPLKDEDLASINKSGIIEREIEAYNILIPKLNNIFTSNGDSLLTPKLYKSELENIMIMENLFAKHYKMVSKQDQLDYVHGVAVLNSIAKFHAASVKLHESNPKLVEKVGRHLLLCYDMHPDVKSAINPTHGEKRIDLLISEFDNWPETRPYVSFLRKLRPKYWDTVFQALDYTEDEFVALNHGDLYTNNILFKYNEKGLIDKIKFVDLQLLRYTCPAVDVLFFIYTSIKYEVITERYEDLTQYYLQQLNLYLEKYDCNKRWNNEDFQKSIKIREIYALIICLNMLPYMFASYSDTAVLPEFPYMEFSRNERYRKTCVKFFERFAKEKWFQNV